MNIKRANNILKRHLQFSALIYSIFGAGTICWYNSEFLKVTFLWRVVQASLIMKRIQEHILIILISSRYWKNKLHVVIWLGVVLFHVMKMFAMFINGIRGQNLISSMIHNLGKIDKNILQFSLKKKRKSLLYSYRLYFFDMFGFTFFFSYQMLKYLRNDVSGFVDVIFFLKASCIMMHSSFCKYVFVMSLLYNNVNEQFRMLKELCLSQDRTIQVIKILTVQHRSIGRVWGKLMQIYEPYLFFHVLSLFLDMIYVIKKVYMYIDDFETATNFQLWHVFIGALWSFYEILSICILCTKVAIEVSLNYCRMMICVIFQKKMLRFNIRCVEKKLLNVYRDRNFIIRVDY